jgi:O-antigen/teichoic acid export membrane protein
MPTKRLLKQVSVLALGSGIAQAVGILASPIVTRLFSPEDYAVLTVFLAVVSTFLPFVCGRYEIAIVVAGTDRHARDLVALCIWLAGAVSLCLAIPAVLLGAPIARMLNCAGLEQWVPLAAVAIFLGGVAMVLRCFANRRVEYGTISRYMLFQAVASISLNLCFGFAHWGASGLILANLLATALGVSWLAWKSRGAIVRADLAWGPHLRSVGAKYRDFPIFNASSTVLDSLALAMPVFFVSRLCSAETVGHYGLLMRVAQAPLMLVSGAVTQVHLKHVSDLVRDRQDLIPYLRRVTLLLVALALPLAAVFCLWSPALFAFAFGERWRPAGEYLAILAPSIAVQFVVSTLSPTCGATGNNRFGAAWKALAFIATLALFALLAPRLDARGIFVALSITNIVLYAAYYAMIWYSARHPRAFA